MAPEELFLGNLPRIEQLIRSTCRRHRMPDAEIDDFASAVKLKFIENNYAVLRQYEGKSSLPTYLYIVIQRFYLDYRDHQWGRWRPSAEAKRQGDAAVDFERLTRRDGEPFEAACRTIQQRHPDVSRAQVESWDAKLPARTRRARVEQSVDDIQIAAIDSAEDRVLETETHGKAVVAGGVLRDFFAQLPAEEQLIVRMRFSSGLKVVTIANTLGIDQKRLYRTLERLMAQLRDALAAGGVDATDIADVLEQRGAGIDIPFLTSEAGILATAPSNHAAEEGSALPD